METPEVKDEFFKKTGSRIQNMLGEDTRIYGKMLNLDGELDKEKETRSPFRMD